MKHDNFIDMLGYCTERNLRIVAYEFATMGSLHDVLHGMILHIYHALQSDKNISILVGNLGIGVV